MVSRGNGLERCGKGIECHPIAAVADRVGTHLKTATKAELGHLLEVSGLSHKQSGVSRIVRVFGEEGGAPRAQRTVGVRLDYANPYAAAVKSASRTDRKSTRLNSSNGYISYAVFCSKKKSSN